MTTWIELHTRGSFTALPDQAHRFSEILLPTTTVLPECNVMPSQTARPGSEIDRYPLRDRDAFLSQDADRLSSPQPPYKVPAIPKFLSSREFHTAPRRVFQESGVWSEPGHVVETASRP